VIKTQPVGIRADLEAKVDISKVHGGYFSSEENARQFIKAGITPIKKKLPQSVRYVDFGGGQGFLASAVRDYLLSHGKDVATTVADANNRFLDQTKALRISTLFCNLAEGFPLSELDLITMRAVNHYNDISMQLKILKNGYRCLKKGGYVVSQISTGNEGNCRLRSDIVNLDSLGRVMSSEKYYWTTEAEYVDMLKQAGFTKIIHAGYAPPCSWTPEEQWERFNGAKTTEALNKKDKKILREIESQKLKFLKDANDLIQDYITSYSEVKKDIEKKSDGSNVIRYSYAIIIANK